MTSFVYDDTQAKVIKIVSEKLNIDKNTIKLESTMQDLGADSLDLVEIIMKLEETFGLEIADEDSSHLNTMQDFINYIHQHRTK